uniref:Potassium/proton antiporter CemA n=1 Tax=Pogonatum inflexum TaxID=185755 RepID=A0A5J6XHD7_9BRYO|nr:chloroplast envelope membrane protein [Pogonatum inflexum]
MKSYWTESFCWLTNTPYRSLERAYKASKQIRSIKNDYISYKNMVSSSRRSSQAIMLYINTNLNNCVFLIYWSLLEYKISFFFFNFLNTIVLVILKIFNSFSLKDLNYHKFFTKFQQQIFLFFKKYFWINFLNIFSFFPSNIKNPEELKNNEINCFISRNFIKKNLREIKKMNKKLAWIEATLNDLIIWKQYYSFSFFSSKNEETFLENPFYFFNSKKLIVTTRAYESISLIPRSIIRTLYGFQAELTEQSKSLVLQDFQVARYQALASLQYLGCLLFFPWGFSIFFKKCFLEPWIKNWWNTYQLQIFLNSFQEEIALNQFQEVEELIWLDKVMINSLKIDSKDLNIEIHQKTIQLVKTYNEKNIQIILHLLTDITHFVILGGLFFLGKERLIILNSWIQELFYSLSDTMKAFFILLLTDLCIGFHSPHGWEIVIGSFLEHLGFEHNKNIISCFVSTFPVILDTVSKYWIFRHLNRISPSIVATYHTMNE